MSRAAQRFRATDVTKAIKAMVAAGVSVGRVEISPDGRIVLIAATPGQEQSSPLDQWRAKHGQG